MKADYTEMLFINVQRWYNHPEYYRYMPRVIFESLEEAFKVGSHTAAVRQRDFLRMTNEMELNNGIKSN